MKVKLTGINPFVKNELNIEEFIKELQLLDFPIVTNTYKKSLFFDEELSKLVLIGSTEWSIDWFTYEEIKEVKN